MIATARSRYRLWPFVPHDPIVRAYRSLGIISAAQPGGPVLPVTFPATPLNNRVMIALTPDPALPYWQWGWADITQYVRHADAISVTSGRQDEASTVDAGGGALTLDNTDGRFSRRNPYGPYYGFLTKNTPIWCQVDPGSGFITTMQHFVNEWPSRWDISRNDATVPIKTAGILRRLRQGRVFKSPLRRAITFANPLAYWPMEDGADTPIPAGMGQTGQAVIVSPGPAAAGTGPIPTGSVAAWTFTAGGSMSFPTGQAAGAAPTGWEFEFTGGWNTLPTVADGTFVIVAYGLSSGPGIYSGVGIGNSSGVYYWVKYQIESGGGAVFNYLVELASPQAGRAYHVRVRGIQAVPNMRVGISVDGVDASPLGFAGTLQMPTAISVNTAAEGFAAGNIDSFSHLAFWTPYRTAATTYQAASGYTGEEAHARVARICGEEQIPFTATTSRSVAMGPQPIDTALNIFRDCEQADLGSLYEAGFGLGFQGHDERDNAPVRLTLDMDLGHVADPPEPADDDQRVRNRFTASRSNGSEATFEKADGPMGTGVGGPGLYDDSATLNLASDDELYAAASARVLFGTVDEDRWPLVTSDLAATPDLIPTWAALQPFGARINITHPPSQMAPDTIDAFIDGYTQQWTPLDWDIALNTTPASPHHVFVLAETSGDLNPFKGYLTPTSCVLAADLDTTSVSVTITSSTPWSTAADDWTPPPTITIEGEDMTVSAVAGSSNPQTLTVARSANGVVKAHAAGVAVAFKSPGVLGL